MASDNPSFSDLIAWLSYNVTADKYVEMCKAQGWNEQQVADFIQRIGHDIHILNVSTTGIFFTVCIAAYAIGKIESRRQMEDKFIRGARLYPPKVLTKMLRKQWDKGNLKIGQLTIGKKQENLSMFICGKPQSGKTVVFNYLLTEIQRRRQPAVVLCAKPGDFITTHFQPDSLVFCPPDMRSVMWSLKNDIESIEDFDVLANVFAPINPNAKDAMWDKGKQIAVRALFHYWWLETDRSNKELARIAKLKHNEMAEILKVPGLEDAYGLISNVKSQTAYSFYVNILCDLQPLQLLAKNDGDFSIKDFVATGKNTIFLPCSDKLQASLGPIYTAFFELFTIHFKALPEDRMRRFWTLIDELPAIRRISRLPDLLSVAASNGICCVLGSQSIVQLDSRYGIEERRTILNACATQVYYCVEDYQTAEELSKNIGREDVEKSKENLSTSSADNHGGVTVMTENRNDWLVTPDMMRNIPPLKAYVRVGGFGTTELMKIKYVPYPKTSPAFVQNPAYSLETYVAEHKARMQELKINLDLLAKEEAKDNAKTRTVQPEEIHHEHQTEDEQMGQMIVEQDDGFFP